MGHASAQGVRTSVAKVRAVSARGRSKLGAIAGRGRARREWKELSTRIALLPPAARVGASIAIVESSDSGSTNLPDTDLVCLRQPTTQPLDNHWIDRCAAVISAEVVGAAPQVVHPRRGVVHAMPDDARIRALGLDVRVRADAPVIVARGAGRVAVPSGQVSPVFAASAAALVLNRRSLEDAGGFPTANDPDAFMLDVCRRLRARGRRLVVVPSAVVVDHRSAVAEARGWRTYLDEHAPALMREARPLAPGALRICLTVAAPSEKVAARWGDWHLAHALSRSLQRLGHSVRVETFDRRDNPAARACDVRCVIRGLRPVPRSPAQSHVLWIISHPDEVEVSECEDADLVLVASQRFAADLRTRTDTPVEVMLQATDPERFRPMPIDPRHSHDVVVVAKSRDVYRSAVRKAVEAGLRPAIYGSGWKQFVESALIASEYVANENLSVVYSSAGVLLNDHWDDMRSNGFVSNRIFDALACRAPVISDDMPEIEELFCGAVPTYRNNELSALIEATLSDRAAAYARAERGRSIVLARHTFDHRARQFIDALLRHGLHPNA